MKYIISTHELEWHDRTYKVEANSEDEAYELVESGDAFCDSDIFDVTDQIDFNWIKEDNED